MIFKEIILILITCFMFTAFFFFLDDIFVFFNLSIRIVLYSFVVLSIFDILFQNQNLDIDIMIIFYDT